MGFRRSNLYIVPSRVLRHCTGEIVLDVARGCVLEGGCAQGEVPPTAEIRMLADVLPRRVKSKLREGMAAGFLVPVVVKAADEAGVLASDAGRSGDGGARGGGRPSVPSKGIGYYSRDSP